MMNEKTLQLAELLQDDLIVQRIKESDAEKALQLLAENNLVFTKEELKDALVEIANYDDNQEISLEEAEMISGGRKFTVKDWLKGVASTVRGLFDELIGW